MDPVENLIATLEQLDVVTIVRDYYARFKNDAPPELIKMAIAKVQKPNPYNNEAMAELHRFVQNWSMKNKLREKELSYLGMYLSGRLDAQVKMEAIRSLTNLYEETTTKKVYEGILKMESVDDGGQARIATVVSQPDTRTDPEDQMFVRVQSWDEHCEHPQFKEFEGKKVRVTVEVLE